MSKLEIMWTKVDEAPALATYSLLPIVKAFVGAAGVSVTLKDISLAGRIIATFPEKLTPAQRINDELTELGDLTLKPEANIMKLPNISASIPQLRAAIKELQGKGYAVPDYPDNPTTDAEKDIKTRYGKVFWDWSAPPRSSRSVRSRSLTRKVPRTSTRAKRSIFTSATAPVAGMTSMRVRSPAI